MAIAYKADIVLNHKSGIVADATHMGIYLATGLAATPTDFDNMKTHISAFFNTTPTGAAVGVHAYLAACFDASTNAHEIRFYQLPGVPGPLGSPVAMRNFTIASPGTTGLPGEVASVLSYQRTYGTDVEFAGGGTRPRARDRGRIYLGPLIDGAFSLDPITKESRLDPTNLSQVATKAAKQFLGAAMTADSITWVQFSHATWSFDAVTRVWMDNAADIQRRRGVLATVVDSETI